MKSYFLTFLLFLSCFSVMSQSNLSLPFDDKPNTTVTYEEGIQFIELLAKGYPTLIKVSEFGLTDSGKPLHEIIYNQKGQFNPYENAQNHIVFINNGIHPGEPDGINASLMLLRELCTNEDLRARYEDITLVVIPFYNVGGVLNRNSFSRANQNGPESYGFRGNAKNYDLNRDFIKTDSKNAMSFNQLFQKWNPLVYLETHVSNGADYAYTLTHLVTQADKLGGKMGDLTRYGMIPYLEEEMKANHKAITPYVNVYGTEPREGWAQFMDSPRYSTGYTTLFQTYGMMTETHMLKPFPERVKATYNFITVLLDYVKKNGEELKKAKELDQKNIQNQTYFTLQWELDKNKYRNFDFDGYEANTEKSDISGLERMRYDKSKPYRETVKIYEYYTPSLVIKAPKAYLIPQGYIEILERLSWNKVKMDTLEKDILLSTETYFITDYQTRKSPYEGHYLHYNTKIRTEKQEFLAKKGDILVYINQIQNRYIVETLEPQGVDSFFNWNFFDAILQQKEHFSSYVFEDIAAQLLNENPELKGKLEEKRKTDEDFAKSAYQQLEFIYQNSPYYEPTHNRYPILRVME